MHLLKYLTVVAVLGLVWGCGGDPTVKVEQTSVSPEQTLKAGLEEVAQSGELGSGVETLQEAVEKLQASDAAKGDAMAKELETLKSLSDPAAIKTQAKKMADQL
ncbi:MAG: hypothetical protein GXX96_18600 [Planctomycetaceae bacterium]|nr:hypothetical protein [Planctomycetaceae bacterium]